MRVYNLNQSIEDSFLNYALLVGVCGKVLEFDGSFDVGAEFGNELDVDIGFHEGAADLFDHAIEGLFVESLSAGEVVERRIDAAAEVLQYHPDGVVGSLSDSAAMVLRWEVWLRCLLL